MQKQTWKYSLERGKSSRAGFVVLFYFSLFYCLPSLRMPYLVLNDAIITMMSTYLGLRRNIILQWYLYHTENLKV